MNTIVLTAEELFYMAKFLKAKYLDYEYVTLVSDLSTKIKMKEAMIIDSLNNKGLIFEDFSGEIEIEDVSRVLLEPIFFGEIETEYLLTDVLSKRKIKYHLHNNEIIQVIVNGKELEISKLNDLPNLTPYCDKNAKNEIFPSDKFEGKEVDAILVIKRNEIGKNQNIIQILIDQNIAYCFENNKLVSKSQDDLNQIIKDALWRK